MADFLMYWKYFWQDVQEDSNYFNNQWHTEQKHFYDKVKKDDSLWVVVFGEDLASDEWRLLQRIIVERKRINVNNGRRYGIYGNDQKSQQFDIEAQSDFTPTLQKLEFISGKKLKAKGRAIGNAIQAIRPLSESDGNLLKDYSRNLRRHKTDAGFEELISEETNSEIIEKEFEEFVRKGAGFGNPKTNKKVERSAIEIVTKDYESNGWKVKSVEAEKCGYDLICTKGTQEKHVEVKGIQGNLPAFIITFNEVQKAENDINFIICAVTSALSPTPVIHSYTGQEFIEKFDIKPLAFRATLQNQKGDWKKAREILAKVPDVEAEDYDKL